MRVSCGAGFRRNPLHHACAAFLMIAATPSGRDCVASRALDHCRAGALGHDALRCRRDHPVVSRDQIPARLLPPRSLAHRALERTNAPWNLQVGHERGLLRLNVGRKRSGEFRLVEEQEAILRWQYGRHGCARRRVLDQRGDGLALVRRKGCDVDQFRQSHRGRELPWVSRSSWHSPSLDAHANERVSGAASGLFRPSGVPCALQLAIFVGGATDPHDIRQVIAAARFEQKNADIGIFR